MTSTRDGSSPRSVAPADLRWVGALLLGRDQADRDVAVGRDLPAGHTEVFRFAVVPSLRRPYLLMPADAPRAAATALRDLGNPLKRSVRLAESAAATALRTGLPQRLGGAKVLVSVPASSAPSPGDTLLGLIGAVLGRPDLTVAVILGSARPNRKPVLIVLSPAGDCVAFAKVGWNAVSRELVRREAAVLRELAEVSPPRTFRVPRVIDLVELPELDLLLVTALPRASAFRDGPPRDLPVEATREVAHVHGAETAELATSHYWSDLRRRVESVGGAEHLLADALDDLERRFGARDVPLGTWHGDWIPWNMSCVGGSLHVWDWERSRRGVPIGLDAAHFDFDLRTKLRGEAPGVAARSSMAGTAGMLTALGAPADLSPLLVALNLLEMTLRFHAGRAAGLDVVDPLYRPALAHLIGSRPGADEPKS